MAFDSNSFGSIIPEEIFQGDTNTMACFLVPTVAAIITTSVKKKAAPKLKLEVLNLMLWGGAAMSIVDHIINREVVPYPPFFTSGLSAIPLELLRVGVPMTLAIVLIWAVMVLATLSAETRSSVSAIK
jgi:hypothetical protein